MDDNKIYLEKLAEDLKKTQSAELKKLQTETELNFCKSKKKIIEIESNIGGGENFSPLQIKDCIFFESQLNFDEDTKTLPYGPFFLSVSYEEQKKIFYKDFQGQDFKYQLVPNYRFVEAEEKLFLISEIYNTPLQIYSPYARRAVGIRISGKTAGDFIKLDDLNFQLTENNLSDKLLMNNKFFWNVKIKKSDGANWFQRSEDLFEYGFEADERSFILPQTDLNFDDKIEAKKTEGKIILRSSRELPEDFELIRIFPVENKIDSRIFSKPRIRTQGDIEFVLKCFEQKNFSCTFGSQGDAGKKILRYSTEHKYFSSQDENLLRAKRKLPVMNVKFRGDKNFLTDYANYVLHFLEENYPEFNWAGEVDE